MFSAPRWIGNFFSKKSFISFVGTWSHREHLWKRSMSMDLGDLMKTQRCPITTNLSNAGVDISWESVSPITWWYSWFRPCGFISDLFKVFLYSVITVTKLLDSHIFPSLWLFHVKSWLSLESLASHIPGPPLLPNSCILSNQFFQINIPECFNFVSLVKVRSVVTAFRSSARCICRDGLGWYKKNPAMSMPRLCSNAMEFTGVNLLFPFIRSFNRCGIMCAEDATSTFDFFCWCMILSKYDTCRYRCHPGVCAVWNLPWS